MKTEILTEELIDELAVKYQKFTTTMNAIGSCEIIPFHKYVSIVLQYRKIGRKNVIR